MLSEGGYGCIFYPSIKTKKLKNMYQKFKKIILIQNEAYMGNILKNVPSYLNHFVSVIESDAINIKIDDDDVDKCTIFMKYKDTPFINENKIRKWY